MRLDYFKTLVIVARTGSFSAAAKKLEISQGTVSNHIATLEREFDAKLFKRTIKGVELTEAGKILQERVEKLLNEIENTKAQISITKSELAGVIRIAASTIPGEHIIPSLIAESNKRYPDVKFRIKAADTITSLMSLDANDADFAAVGSLKGYEQKFDTIELGEEELLLIVPRNHELTKKKSIKPLETLKYSYINREETSGTRKEVEKILEAAGIPVSKLDVALELGSTESVITAVSEGRGISIISSIAAKKAEAAGLVKILRIDDTMTSRKLYMVRPKRSLLKVCETFWQFCKEFKWQKDKPPSSHS